MTYSGDMRSQGGYIGGWKGDPEMCCLFASLVLIGPRFAILVWWIIDQARWTLAFESFIIAFVGWLLVPWTTISYVIVFPGGVTGFDWVIIGLGILADFASWTNGAWSGRRYQVNNYQVS